MTDESKDIRTPMRFWTPEKYNLLLRVALLIVSCSAAAVVGFAIFGKGDTEIRGRGLEGKYIYGIVQSDDGARMIAVGVRSGDPELDTLGILQDTAFVAYSRDTGGTWSEVELGFECDALYHVELDWTSGKGVCTGSNGVILFTSDTGTTWERAAVSYRWDSAEMSSHWNSFTIDWKTGKGFYCFGDIAEVLYTTDYGHTWKTHLIAGTGGILRPDDFVWGMTFDWSSGYGVMRIESLFADDEPIQDKPGGSAGEYIVQTFDTAATWERTPTNASAKAWLAVTSESAAGMDVEIAGVNAEGKVSVSSTYFPGLASTAIRFTNVVQTDPQVLYHKMATYVQDKRAVAVAYDSASPAKGVLAEIHWDNTDCSYRKIILDTAGRLTAVSVNNNTGHFVAGSIKGRIWTSNKPGEWTLIHPLLEPSTSTSEFMLILGSLALCAFGALLGITIYRKHASQKTHEPGNIVESVLGVNPDNPTDQDKLGFASTTKALVDLMRNPDLRPPLSVVVNGDWGSGKTSLMLQVKKQLEEPLGEKRFITTWFNIWHFENEEQMFHAFITSLSNGLEKAAGFRFRLRIFYSKLMKLHSWDRLAFGFGFGVMSVLVGLLAWVLSALVWNSVVTLSGIDFPFVLPHIDYSWFGLNNEDLFTEILVGGGTLGALVLGLLNLGGKFSKSGLSAIVELIPLEKLRMKMDKGVSGVREQFRKEFREIMKAAKKENASLVVFIDDLDRANGEHIRSILATMNFISDVAANAGNTEEDKFRADIFFVMGMASDVVVNNMNRSMFGDDPQKIVQGQSAENYLEKMVDIVIRVPRPKSELLTQITTDRYSSDEK